eukprot:4640268-Prymnesium_polylepis.1
MRWTASSSKSTRRTTSPERVLYFLPCSSHTMPKGQWSRRWPVTQPAAVAASKIRSLWGHAAWALGEHVKGASGVGLAPAVRRGRAHPSAERGVPGRERRAGALSATVSRAVEGH